MFSVSLCAALEDEAIAAVIHLEGFEAYTDLQNESFEAHISSFHVPHDVSECRRLVKVWKPFAWIALSLPEILWKNEAFAEEFTSRRYAEWNVHVAEPSHHIPICFVCMDGQRLETCGFAWSWWTDTVKFYKTAYWPGQAMTLNRWLCLWYLQQ